MKIRFIKEYNGKPSGKVGLFLDDFANELIKKGLAEKLDDDFIVDAMPEKKEVEQPQPIYIPVPMPMEYFNENKESENITHNKKK